MAAAKKAAEAGSKDEAQESPVATTDSKAYLAPGVAPDLTPGTPSLDPELEKIRDAEIEKLSKVEIDVSPKVASIDPELEKARDEQIKRETARASK